MMAQHDFHDHTSTTSWTSWLLLSSTLVYDLIGHPRAFLALRRPRGCRSETRPACPGLRDRASIPETRPARGRLPGFLPDRPGGIPTPGTLLEPGALLRPPSAGWTPRSKRRRRCDGRTPPIGPPHDVRPCRPAGPPGRVPLAPGDLRVSCRQSSRTTPIVLMPGRPTGPVKRQEADVAEAKPGPKGPTVSARPPGRDGEAGPPTLSHWPRDRLLIGPATLVAIQPTPTL